jgi:hypothetical protein
MRRWRIAIACALVAGGSLAACGDDDDTAAGDTGAETTDGATTAGTDGATAGDAATTDDAGTDDAATGDGATGDAATGDGATGDAATGDGATGDAATGDGATGDAATGDDTGDTVRVSIGGGPDEGEHERTDVNANCTVGLIATDGFGVQYSDDTVEDGLSSVQAQLVDDFDAAVTIGPLFGPDSTTYRVGSGTADVDIEAEQPVFTIDGTTQDGIEVDIEVQCGSVQRY